MQEMIRTWIKKSDLLNNVNFLTMKKLESLASFGSRTMNKEMMAKIMGGINAPVPGGVCTEGGMIQNSPVTMLIYSSDCINRSEGPNQYYTSGSVQDKPCNA
jgi:hypothetical protein